MSARRCQPLVPVAALIGPNRFRLRQFRTVVWRPRVVTTSIRPCATEGAKSRGGCADGDADHAEDGTIDGAEDSVICNLGSKRFLKSDGELSLEDIPHVQAHRGRREVALWRVESVASRVSPLKLQSNDVPERAPFNG